MPEHRPPTIGERWSQLDRQRQTIIGRGRHYSALTIPSVLPQHGSINHEELPVPNNNMPAEGLNNLGARIVSVLLPLNGMPIFELIAPLDEVAPDDKMSVEQAFRQVERHTMEMIVPTNLRDTIFEGVLHLMIVGNVGLEQMDDYNFRLWRLDQYVVRRYTDGRWYEIITRDSVNPHELPPELSSLPTGGVDTAAVFGMNPINRHDEPQEAVFTQVLRNRDDTFTVTKEFRGVRFSQQIVPASPIVPLRWKSATGEDYGRGEVEESFGDITALDALTRGMTDGALLNAEHRWRISPLSLVSIDDFMDSVNGEAIAAEQGEVEPLQFTNHAQVQSTLMVMQHLENRLGRRFLMNSAVQPRGERVTARQVSILAEELEAGLGGVLSVISREMQIPIVRHTMFLMTRDGLLTPEIAQFLTEREDILRIRIRAGLEVLQREAEFEKLSILIEQVRNLPPEAQRVFRWPALLTRWIVNMGIDPDNLIRTEEDLAAEDEAIAQQQQAQMLQQQAMQMGAQMPQ